MDFRLVDMRNEIARAAIDTIPNEVYDLAQVN